jgi:hypothetical protein
MIPVPKKRREKRKERKTDIERGMNFFLLYALILVQTSEIE